MNKTQKLKKDIGLFIATALVTGNMMGSGIFMLPATLASKSGPGATILAWLITGIGSIFLALSFANLGSKIPKAGGPYEYSKLAFGDFIGFINAWLYWNGSWIGNAAVVIAVASYSSALFPILSQSHLAAFLYASAVLWIFTIVNIIGVKRAGSTQTAITVFEICLFLFFIAVSAIHFKTSNIMPLFPSGKGINTLSAAATSTLWAFVGLETASITAEEIKNPERNVKLSTIFGILVAVVMYLAINISAMGAMPQNELAKSASPIADILKQFLGKSIATVIIVGSVISVLGTTVGWLLSTARVAYAAGKDGLFPEIFAQVHPKFKTPHTSLIIGSILVNLLLLMNYTKSLVSAFTFIILLATLSFLPVYAFTAASEIMLLIKKDKKVNVLSFIKNSIVPLLGFTYAMWTIYGSGAETVMYGFIMLMCGIPFYIYMKYKNSVKLDEVRKVLKN
ncbi:amino acid permease [Thermoanaerobacterium thermosaccharolyticum]|uniref:APC family permease n=1 Tax=Thermoanaerobacterium thermosaccharolyticum TaxID=1517 RepID=UPI00279B9E0F|nr:amino acid permease [Thermoanaerobacterium thermosaccharolyticum]